jgi:hypothetical protein
LPDFFIGEKVMSKKRSDPLSDEEIQLLREMVRRTEKIRPLAEAAKDLIARFKSAKAIPVGDFIHVIPDGFDCSDLYAMCRVVEEESNKKIIIQ